MSEQGGNQTTIIIQRKGNGVGTAGFVLALLALIGLIFCLGPFFNFIMWILGVILSFVGVFKKPKGFAIAGLVLSSIWLIIVSVIFGSIASMAF